MKLWEINELIIKAIEFGYDPETGEILDDSRLKELEMARDEKLEQLILWVKDIRAEEEAIKNEEKALKDRREASHRKGDSITRYIQNSLNGEKFKTSKCAVSYRKSYSVEILDQDLIPSAFLRTKTTVEPDKTVLRDVLKAGGEIPGVRLDEHQNIQIK